MKSKWAYPIGIIFNFLNKLIPKTKNKCVISAFPDFEDMTRGLLPLLHDKKIVILTAKNYSTYPKWVGSNVIAYKKYSLMGIYSILTAETIYVTHGLFSFFKKLDVTKQKVVNVWHGMPLKNIGLLDGKKSVPDSHEIYSTSPFFQKIMADAFGKKLDEVLVSGLPRNNILLLPVVNEHLLNLKKQFDKIIVWLPTYRKTTFGDIRNDGEELTIYGFSDFDAEKFNEALKNKNILVIIKPHPLASKTSKKDNYSNLLEIDEDWLLAKELTLYELLGASDMLWTDFSSVFVDYLVLKRPIVFVVPDMEEYQNNRGLTWNINELPLPGIIVTSSRDLIDFLNRISFQSYSTNEAIFNNTYIFKL
jgi:CDP-glycerol glycerophosphotransferase (TagB/SpsB family)